MSQEQRTALIERNVAAAPPFSAETLEKLAALFGPAAAEVRRERMAEQRRAGKPAPE